MPEPPPDLRRLLSELHGQLESLDSVGPELRDPLRTLLSDIRSVLDVSRDAQVEHPTSLVERLSELALAFETSHPTLAGTINRITHQLSSLGI